MKKFVLLLALLGLGTEVQAAETAQNLPYSYHRIKEPTAGMWQDFYSEHRPMGKVHCYVNDFHSWDVNSWTVTEVGTATQTILDMAGGVLSLGLSSTSENDGSQAQLGGTSDSATTGESFAPVASKNLWFETRVQGSDLTQHDFFVGLHVQDTTIVASRGSDYIGFRNDDGDLALDVENAASSTASEQTSVFTLANDTWVKLGFKVTTTDKVEFWVNDVKRATNTSNIPTALMKASLAQLTGEAAANELDVDYVVICQDR